MKIFGIFDVDVIYTLPILISLLWAWGGSGVRHFRKYGVPLAVTAFAYGYGQQGWGLTVTAIGLLAVIGFGPGYGDYYVKVLKIWYWPYIFLLGLLYGLFQFGLCLQFGRWEYLVIFSIIGSISFVSCLYTSKELGLHWKIAELITGFFIGLTSLSVIGV